MRLVGFLLCLFTDPEDGGSMFLRNVSGLLPAYLNNFHDISLFVMHLLMRAGTMKTALRQSYIILSLKFRD
jgi:hypothetical protein